MRRHKYNAHKTVVDGITFDSAFEAERYGELKLMEKAGEITGLTLQPKFELLPPFSHSGRKLRAVKYVADFQYVEILEVQGVKFTRRVVEDVKGIQTPVFKIKAKMFLHSHGNSYVLRIVTRQGVEVW